MGAAIILALILGLAFANGANDVSKGIATLVGSGVTDYRRAVLWGSLWTVAGGVLAAFLGSELAATFSGRGGGREGGGARGEPRTADLRAVSSYTGRTRPSGKSPRT